MGLLVGIYLLSCVVSYTNALDCKDQNNNKVDWFIVYKIPQLEHDSNHIKEGLGYVYMTSDDETWKLSNISIKNPNSIIANTLESLYLNKTDTSYVLYNDEPPNNEKPNLKKGFCKGLVAVDGYGGFWMIHSVPNFPDISVKYVYPASGTKDGQMLFCFSMNLPFINQVGTQLLYNHPNVYKRNISKDLKSRVPNLLSVSRNTNLNSVALVHTANLLSKKNVRFLSFARKHNEKDIYLNLIASYLESSLLVQSWPNEPKRLKSDCKKKYGVNNIKTIEIEAANVKFFTSEDHSIWAITSPKFGKYWICIGDINRSDKYKLRGGGAVCFENKKAYEHFLKMISFVEDCKPLVYNI